MATRRIVASERTILEKDDVEKKSDIAPAVPKCVLPRYSPIHSDPPPVVHPLTTDPQGCHLQAPRLYNGHDCRPHWLLFPHCQHRLPR